MHTAMMTGIPAIRSTRTCVIAALLMVLTIWPGASAQTADSSAVPAESGAAVAGEPPAQGAGPGPNLTWQKFPAEFADYYTTQRVLTKPAEPQPFCKSAKPLLLDNELSSFRGMQAILDESGGTGTGYDTLYVDTNGTGDFTSGTVYKVSPQDRKTGLEGHPLVGYFDNVHIPTVVAEGRTAHVQMFLEHDPAASAGSEFVLNLAPAQWAVGTVQINGQPTPIAMVDGNFNDSVVNRRGMRPWSVNQMTPGDDAGVVKSDYIIIGKPGETALQPGDPNGWLGKTGSARSMNTQYVVTESGAFEIQQEQTEQGVNLELVPANVPMATLDLSQVPQTGGRLSLFGANTCVLLDNPTGTVQVPGDTYYVPAFGAHLVDVPAGGNATLVPPEGFATANPGGFDPLADRTQRLFTQMESPAGEPGTAGAVRWAQPSADPYAFAAARPGWRKVELLVVAAETKQPIVKAAVTASCYSGGGLGGSGSRKLTTDAVGKCVIPLPSGDLQYLSASVDADGYVPLRMYWGNRVGGSAIPEQYTWTMEKGTTIGGVVRDERGRPIRGVQVTLEAGQSNFFGFDKPQPNLSGLQITTDSRGKWQCKSAPAKLSQIQVGLKHPDYISDEQAARTVKVEDLRSQTAELIMKQGILLTGKVTGAKGKPVDSAVVNYGGYQKYTQTDRQGRFRIGGLAPGEVTLTIRAEGFPPTRKKLTVEENMRPVDIKLQGGQVLKGRVIDAAGRGVPLAEVFLQSWEGGTSWWYAKTDAQGRFTWADAPDGELTLSVSADGYASSGDWHVKPGREEQVLTLKAQMQVSGRVVDAATRAAIPSFTAIPGMVQDDSASSVYWMRYASTTGKDGTFRLKLDDRGPRFQVRVEAAGYKPGVSKVLTEDQIGQSLEFALEAGQGPSGIVLGIDGQPVAGAQVMLATPSQPAMIVDGRAQSQMTSVTQTGSDGRFSLLPQTDSFLLVALHDSGFAKATEEHLKQNKPVRLQAWGRIEGEVRTGGKPGAGEAVQLGYSMDGRADSPRIYFHYQATADEQGRFTFERAVPGDASVTRSVPVGPQVRGNRMMGNTHATPVEVKAGQTAHVTIGGTGRPVIGRLSLPVQMGEKADWSSSLGHVSLQRKGPDVPADVKAKGGEAVQAWHREWSSSDAGRAWQRESRDYMFQPEPDGSFRIEDMPAGKYMLSVQLFKPADDGERRGFGTPLANLSYQFSVPEIRGGRSDQPLDLGTVALQIPSLGRASVVSTRPAASQPSATQAAAP